MRTLQISAQRFFSSAPHRPMPHGILAVDADEMVRTLLGTYFREQGLRIWLASDGEEAVELYQENHDDIAFVAMDLDLPGMGARETLAGLQAVEPDVVCYFMTADWAPDAEDAVRETGAVGVVVKPFLLGFLNILQGHLAKAM